MTRNRRNLLLSLLVPTFVLVSTFVVTPDAASHVPQAGPKAERCGGPAACDRVEASRSARLGTPSARRRYSRVKNCGRSGQRCCTGRQKCQRGLDCKRDRCRRQQLCGTRGKRCCGSSCRSGLVCKQNKCRTCGRAKDPCCARNSCNRPYVCRGGTCLKACGGKGQACCAGRVKCQGGLACITGRCRCGSKDAPCCRRGRKCDQGLTCDKENKCWKECGAAGRPCCRQNKCHRGSLCYQRKCCKLPKPALRTRFERMLTQILIDTARQFKCQGRLYHEAERQVVRKLVAPYRNAFVAAYSKTCRPGWKRAMVGYRDLSRRMKQAMDALKRLSARFECCPPQRGGRYAMRCQPLDVMGTGAIGYVTNEASMSTGSIGFAMWGGAGMASPF